MKPLPALDIDFFTLTFMRQLRNRLKLSDFGWSSCLKSEPEIIIKRRPEQDKDTDLLTYLYFYLNSFKKIVKLSREGYPLKWIFPYLKKKGHSIVLGDIEKIHI